jgi:predicted MPP superfamily phosphohydrolase
LITRRQFLKRSFAAIAGAGLLGSITGFAETHATLHRTTEIFCPRLPSAFDGLKIAHLTDVHCSPVFSSESIQYAVELANAERPDLFVFTGDFITGGDASYARGSAEACAAAKSPMGSFGCLGNHDTHGITGDAVERELDRVGVRILRNESVRITRGGSKIALGGLRDCLQENPDIRRTWQGVSREDFRLLLAHEPDSFRFYPGEPLDLQLSGHSHGGQVCWPNGSAIVLPRLARQFPRGLYKNEQGAQLYTSVGVGPMGIPIRLFCRPEVNIHILRGG